MLRKSLFILSALLLLGTLGLYAQYQDRLGFNPERPCPGDELNLSYKPLDKMKDAKEIRAVVYMFCDFDWQTKEISLSKSSESLWKSSFKIPDNAGLLAFKFVADTIVDNNNDETYVSMLSAKDGRFAIGAYSGWGLLRAPAYGYSIPDYISSQKASISDSAVFHWMDMEAHNRREASVSVSYLYALSSKKAYIADSEQRIHKVQQFLLSEGSEDALLQSMKIASLENKTQLADSLSNAIMAKYPQGKLALRTKIANLNKEADMNKKYEGIVNILKDFPENDAYEMYLNKFGQSYGTLYQTLLIIDAVNKRYDHVAKYVPKMDFQSTISLFYKLIEVPHMRKDIADSELLPYADIMIENAENSLNKKSYNDRFLTDREWQSKATGYISNSMYITYVDMLKNTGASQKALEYAWKAQQIRDYKSAPLNENMAILLKTAGDDKNLQTVLEKSVFKNQTSETMMSMLKELYVKKHSSADGYDAYVTGLKNPSDKTALLADVEKYRVTGSMPVWKLTDSNGKTVSSQQLKGKVYVLDFWASWCVPCKASFPGMKMAVDHYKDDKDVAFYFIDTQESSANYKTTAINYIRKNNFPFNLLFDNKKTGSKTNDELVSKIMSAYTTSGIPLKVVVDKSGNIRFLSIGYKGSPSGLADELIEMVEQAKKN